jgi:AcrR family transcriptional regulator
VEFAQHGVDGSSTAAICRRAGIGSGTLFHYFPTKIEIFHALFRDDLQRNASVCQEALARPAAGGLEQLLDHLVADLGDPLVPGLTAAALLQVNRDEAFAAMLAEDEAVVRRTLTVLLERLVAEGRELAFPPHATARWIQRLLDACYLSAGDDDADPPATVAELRTMISWLVGPAELPPLGPAARA